MTANGSCYRCGHETGFYDSAQKRWDCGCAINGKHNGERKPVKKGKVIRIRDFRAKRAALIQEAKYGLCGCGSGKKAKFCCWDRLVQEAKRI